MQYDYCEVSMIMGRWVSMARVQDHDLCVSRFFCLPINVPCLLRLLFLLCQHLHRQFIFAHCIDYLLLRIA